MKFRVLSARKQVIQITSKRTLMDPELSLITSISDKPST